MVLIDYEEAIETLGRTLQKLAARCTEEFRTSDSVLQHLEEELQTSGFPLSENRGLLEKIEREYLDPIQRKADRQLLILFAESEQGEQSAILELSNFSVHLRTGKACSHFQGSCQQT